MLPGESIEEILDQINSLIKKMNDDQIKVEIVVKVYPFKEKNINNENELLKNLINTITSKKAKEISIIFGNINAFLTHELSVPSLVLGLGNLYHLRLNDHVKVESL